MDDQTNQGPAPSGAGQGMPAAPVMPTVGSMDSSMDSGMQSVSQTPVPVNETANLDDPHEKIMASLARIEEKLAAIAVKVGV